LEKKGQEITDDCELVRALADSQKIQLLDNTLDKWLQSYCRLFVPLPSQSKLPQVMYLAELYEQVLSQCGNTNQQAQVVALNQLSTKEQFANLNRSGTMMIIFPPDVFAKAITVLTIAPNDFVFSLNSSILLSF
jgi:hypothetical protein